MAIFRTIVQGAAGLSDAGLLASEIHASSICVALRPAMGMDAEMRAAFTSELIGHLEQQRTTDAVAALLGLSVVAEGGLAGDAAAAARRLTAAGVRAPAWIDAIDQTRFTEARLATDEFGDQDFLVIGFEAQTGAHTLAALIDHNIGGIAKDLMVSNDDVGRLLEIWAEVPDNDLVAREIPAEQAAERLRTAIRAHDETFDPPSTDAVPFLRQLALARLKLLPTPLHPTEPEPMTDRQRNRLVKEFIASSSVPSGASTAQLARSLVDFKADYADGDPLRWSPIVVEVCLLDWFPRKVTLDADEIDALPDVLRGWIRFAGERRNLPPAGLAETLAAVDTLAPEFRTQMADGWHAGPAKALFDAMVSEGVDATDQAAMHEWITGFNDRSRSERDAVLSSVGLAAVPLEADIDPLSFAVPPVKGMYEGIALEELDPADGDDRSVLIRAAHAAEESFDLHDDGEMDMDLHLAVHEAVAHQVIGDDPPEVWPTAQRLMRAGHQPHTVLHMLGFAFGGELWTSLRERQPYDADAYRRALAALPDSWLDSEPDPD